MTPDNLQSYIDMQKERDEVKQQLGNPDKMTFEEWQELCRWYQNLNCRIQHILTHP